MDINFSTSSALSAWEPACWLRVSGEDAASFLQGQFSNDLRALDRPEVPAVYGLLLSVKGKVLADAFVGREAGAGGFWVGSYHSPAETVRRRLEDYIIADDVVVEDETAAWAAVTVWGGEAAHVAAEAKRNGAWVFRGRRGAGEAWECVFRRAERRPAGLDGPGWERLTGEEVSRRRIQAGIPAVPEDIGPGDLPAEGGLDADAVSFTKGCYLGQEVMARLRAMGQVRRRLVRVSGDGAVPPVRPVSLFREERAVGELRSAVALAGGGWLGLAMVSRLHVGAGAGLALEQGGPATVRLEDAP